MPSSSVLRGGTAAVIVSSIDMDGAPWFTLLTGGFYLLSLCESCSAHEIPTFGSISMIARLDALASMFPQTKFFAHPARGKMRRIEIFSTVLLASVGLIGFFSSLGMKRVKAPLVLAFIVGGLAFSLISS